MSLSKIEPGDGPEFDVIPMSAERFNQVMADFGYVYEYKDPESGEIFTFEHQGVKKNDEGEPLVFVKKRKVRE